MNDLLITAVRVIDLRFPTSREHIGSEAVNKDPDYSAAYCILETDADVEGHGLTFTLGRGTDLVVQAVEYLARYVTNRKLSSITDDFCAFSRAAGTAPTASRIMVRSSSVRRSEPGVFLKCRWRSTARR